MRNWLKIAEGVDFLPLLNALAVNPDLWNEHTLRTRHPASPHQACDDVWLWFQSLDSDVVDDLRVEPYRAWSALPQARLIVHDLMRRVEGTHLGRVIITRLPPSATIPAHTDGGSPATFYTRYQVALQSRPGATFILGGQGLQMTPGEVWLVNNRVEHSVVNNSDDDRIVMIVDIRGPVA